MRIRGQRLHDILSTTVRLLVESGYDRLTFDRLAVEQHVSKATLYRHWARKADLVVDAVSAFCLRQPQPDTGTLRGDLIAAVAAPDGIFSPDGLAIVADLFAAALHDPSVPQAWARISPSGAMLMPHVWARAVERGEIITFAHGTWRESALVAMAIGCTLAKTPLKATDAVHLVDLVLAAPDSLRPPLASAAETSTPRQ